MPSTTLTPVRAPGPTEVQAPAQPARISVSKPWKRSWFYCARGDVSTFAWVVALHLVGIGGLFFVPAPTWPVVVGALALIVLGGLGTTVCYHRALTHGGLELHPLIKHPLIFFAMLNGSGTPLTWVANHRLHHATSDTAEDISSPSHGGFWWAHLRWLWQAGQADVAHYCPDLNRPIYRFWTRMQMPVLALAFFGGLWFGVTAWIWLGPLRLLWALHLQCSVNSICHLGDVDAVGGSSANVGWLAPFHFLQGENWHRNHHDQPTDPRLGQTAAQVDLGWWSIVVLRFCRLAKNVRRPRQSRATVHA